MIVLCVKKHCALQNAHAISLKVIISANCYTFCIIAKVPTVSYC